MLNNYRVSVCFSYEVDSDKLHDELLDELEQELNARTTGFVLTKKHIVLKKLKKASHRIKLGEFEPGEVFQFVGDKIHEFTVGEKTFSVRMDTARYKVFLTSLNCAACGLRGSKMILEMNQHDKSPHFNLYALENKKLILMTKDHIQPRSKGGKNELGNYQTYCCVCNNLKGNNAELTNEQVKELRLLYNNNCNLSRKALRNTIDLAKAKMRHNHDRTDSL